MFSKRFALIFALCQGTLSSQISGSYKKSESLNPQCLDHGKFKGRWYLFMDTRSANVRDNTYGDHEVLDDGSVLITLYRWFPSLEECRTTAQKFVPLDSDLSVKFEVIRMSTKEKLGTHTILYVNDDPVNGFAIMHQQTHIDTYLITTRTKNPKNLDDKISAALSGLNLDSQSFKKKSTNYGCETKTEKG
ncbi:uncharacterized protein LOC134278026, partial [Saccostrea cucullata]|uniref:uncharacterized protein LOC134278026 n=1 Tax=Saccostrea cuccullata TaxID=36930 RepID=UPI002ED06367